MKMREEIKRLRNKFVYIFLKNVRDRSFKTVGENNSILVEIPYEYITRVIGNFEISLALQPRLAYRDYIDKVWNFESAGRSGKVFAAAMYFAEIVKIF